VTIQTPDSLMYEGKRFQMWSFPLESYLNNALPQRQPGALTCCNRGYTAAWEIDEDALYLTDLKEYLGSPPISLALLFPAQGTRVQATWFTGVLKAHSSGQGGDVSLRIKDGQVVCSDAPRRG
jgi:hypothetical protein